MKRFEKTLFFLVLLSIPIQLGKHFWPTYAFINGIRVDYLSPTLYISDVLILLLLLVSLPGLFKPILLTGKRLFTFLLLTSLLLSSLFASNTQLAGLALLKFFEFWYVGFYISQKVKKEDWKMLITAFTCGALIESFIVLFQFLLQHSIGGILYLLGERTFTASTPGVATFLLNDKQILRGYGTFPHPNVVGFYLLISFALLLHFQVKGSRLTLLKTFCLSLIFLGIIATFSRIIILLSLLFVIIRMVIAYRKKRGKKAIVAVGVVLTCALICVLLLPRFLNGIVRDWLLRVQLLVIFFQIFISHFLFGVGLNNYFSYESTFQKTIGPTLLQPVHNIYVLWIVQTGLIGLFSFIFFISILFKRMKKGITLFYKKNSMFFPTSMLVLSGLFIGLFDHYFLTLHQGQLLSAVILGLFFSNEKR